MKRNWECWMSITDANDGTIVMNADLHKVPSAADGSDAAARIADDTGTIPRRQVNQRNTGISRAYPAWIGWLVMTLVLWALLSSN